MRSLIPVRMSRYHCEQEVAWNNGNPWADLSWQDPQAQPQQLNGHEAPIKFGSVLERTFVIDLCALPVCYILRPSNKHESKDGNPRLGQAGLYCTSNTI